MLFGADTIIKCKEYSNSIFLRVHSLCPSLLRVALKNQGPKLKILIVFKIVSFSTILLITSMLNKALKTTSKFSLSNSQYCV